MFNSREQSQAIVCRGTVKSTCTFVLSYFLNIFSFKRLFCGPLFKYRCWFSRKNNAEEMFLVCWNLQAGDDIYALYNRLVLSCSTGCLCKLWNSCEWWQQTLAGGNQRPFSQHQAPLSMQNNSKLSKKFIWDTSAEKESARKIQCRNYDEGTEWSLRKKRLKDIYRNERSTVKASSSSSHETFSNEQRPDASCFKLHLLSLVDLTSYFS